MGLIIGLSVLLFLVSLLVAVFLWDVFRAELHKAPWCHLCGRKGHLAERCTKGKINFGRG